jgi:exosortase D (VPLPA-CTERM-specific)
MHFRTFLPRQFAELGSCHGVIPSAARQQLGRGPKFNSPSGTKVPPATIALTWLRDQLSHILSVTNCRMNNSVEVAPLLSAREGRSPSILPRWQAGALLLLIAWLYTPIVVRLVLQWVGPHSDPNFEHGVFVPLFAAFVIWTERKRLRAIPAAPSWVGAPIILLSLLILALGVLGSELFFSRVSLLILLAGMVILFRGWVFFRAVLFPWAFLILMIPIPALLMNQVTFPLQLLAAKLATALLQLVGVPVLREGNLIVLAAMPLDVAEACSGIRSLLTLVTLAIIYGYLMETRLWARIALVFFAVPIAVVANSFRIFGTGLLVQYWDPDKAEGFFHTFSGWVIFVAAMIMLFAVHRMISIFANSTLGRPNPSRPVEPGTVASPARKAPPPGQPSTATGSARFAVAAMLLLVTALGLQAHSREETFPPRAPLSSFPTEVDGWTGTDEPIDQPTLDILGAGEFLLRDYENAGLAQQQPDPWINLYIAYFPTQRTGDTIHSPSHCLPGNGYIPVSREVVQIAAPDGSLFPANRYVVSKGLDRELVLYWFQAHGREVASEYWAKYYLIADSIRMNRSDGALVRLMTPMFENETPAAAQSRLMQLGQHFLPLLDTYIPH